MQTAFPRPSIFPERGVPDHLTSTPLMTYVLLSGLSLSAVVPPSGKVPEMQGEMNSQCS